MTKIFTRLAILAIFACVAINANAQEVLWPSADTMTIRVSTFADSTTIRVVKADSTNAPALANYRGWLSVSINESPAAGGAQVASNNTIWEYTPDGTGSKGSLWGTTRTAVISSDVSRGRGAAIFNSNFLDATGKSVSPHKGELWSPIIDATGKNDLVLNFNQYYRHFASTVGTIPCWASTAIAYSSDGGLTWSDQICIEEIDGFGTFEEIKANINVKLKGSKGTNRFRFKFIFDGDYYFWIVDDVKLMRNRNDLKINPNYVAYPQRIMQTTSPDTVRFLADFTNEGAVNAKNVRLRVQVYNTTTKAEVFSATQTFADIKPDSLVDGKVFATSFLPPNTAGGYDIKYSVSSDSTDNYGANDSIRYNNILLVRDTILQQDKAAFILGYAPGAGAYTGNQLRTWKVGNAFFLPKGASTTGSSISGYISGMNQATTARTYVAGLYEWNDANRNDSVEVTERKLVGVGERVVPAYVQGGPTSVLLQIKLENALGSGPLVLKNNQTYIAVFELNPTTAGTVYFAGFGDAPRWDFSPYIDAHYSARQRRYAAIIDNNSNNLNGTWLTTAFLSTQYAPIFNMNIYPIRVGVKDDLPVDVRVATYPNPVVNELSVSVEFPAIQEGFAVNIFDMSGKLLQQVERFDTQKELIMLNVNNLAVGTYLIQVENRLGQVRTMRFVKAN
jgi:Secretion system C-terminal sorting domain